MDTTRVKTLLMKTAIELGTKAVFVCKDCNRIVHSFPSEEDWVCDRCGCSSEMRLMVVVEGGVTNDEKSS